MPLAAGSKLGPYEILALLGAGGMGEVYRARDPRLDRDVALKVSAAQFSERFEREARAVAALNHPNICTLYDVGPNYLVMELVQGEAPQGPLPLEGALRIARQIAAALEEAHDKGITHRDLKPGNIMIKADGTVKVLDFGLAKVEAAVAAPGTNSPTLSMAATQAGIILGTAGYMSPEQARGKPVDKRADIWAFGVVLYELLTGQRLFQGEDVSHTMAAVIMQEPNLDAVPLEVRKLLRRCLEKDPKKRLRDIGDVWQLLEEDAPGLPPPQPGTALLHWVPWAVAGVLLLALAAGAAWHFKPTPSPIVARFPVTLGEGQQFTGTSRTQVAISPDGAQFAYVANARVYLRSMPELEARPVPGTYSSGNAIQNPVFSPDGRSLAFYSNLDTTLKRIAITGGSPVTICHTPDPLGMDWSKEGIVFARDRNIFRVSPSGGTPEPIVSIKADETATRPQMLPGGASVLFTLAAGSSPGTTDWDKAQIVVQTLKSGARKIVHEGGSDARYLPTGQIVYSLGGTLFAVPFDLKRLEATGGAVPLVEGVQRSVTGAAQFGFSANGSLIYIPGAASGTGTNQNSLAMMDRKGAVEPLKLPPGPYGFPRVSHDAKRVVYESDDGKESAIWVSEISGEHAANRLTLTGTGANRYPIWTTDGSRVAFQSDREGDQGIWWQRADGIGTAERLTKPDKGVAHIPDSWSPDGQTFSYTEAKGDVESVWTFSLRDKKATPFASAPMSSVGRSVFSPDGRWIAYQQREQGSNRAQIYVKTFPASSTTHQISKDGNFNRHPVWSRDGKELFHIAGGGAGVNDVSITLQPTFSFTMLAQLPRPFNTPNSTAVRNYDVLDSNHFLGVVPAGQNTAAQAGSSAPQIQVVLNWFEDVKQRMTEK